jgi:hypothetical protein
MLTKLRLLVAALAVASLTLFAAPSASACPNCPEHKGTKCDCAKKGAKCDCPHAKGEGKCDCAKKGGKGDCPHAKGDCPHAKGKKAEKPSASPKK